MLYLKERGMESLDLGGYALNTTDEHMQHINEFKDGFNGELVEMSNYISHSLYCYRKLSHCLNPHAQVEEENPQPDHRAHGRFIETIA